MTTFSVSCYKRLF